jgi:hypothetical protein
MDIQSWVSGNLGGDPQPQQAPSASGLSGGGRYHVVMDQKQETSTQSHPQGIRLPLLPCWMNALEGEKRKNVQGNKDHNIGSSAVDY